MIRTFVILFGLLAIVACKQGASHEELKEVMGLKAQIDACYARVDSIDMDRFMAINDAVKHEMGFMNENNKDTLAQEEAIFLGNYFRFMKKPMARILKGHDNMLKELQKTSTQLEALHHDMKKGLVEPVEYRAELSTERLYAQQHLRLGNEMADDFQKISARFNEDHEKVVTYVNSHRGHVTIE